MVECAVVCGIEQSEIGSLKVREFQTDDLFQPVLSLILSFISGYVIYYTADASAPISQWFYLGLNGDRLNGRVKELTPNTVYYFKAQVRNGWGFGPLSHPVAYRTPTGKFRL